MAVLPLRRYADFSGRSTRSELVSFYLLVIFVRLIPVPILDSLQPPDHFPLGAMTLAAIDLALLCPILALWVRRLHDQGKSGLWLLVFLPALASRAWRLYDTGFSLDPLARAAHPLPGSLQAIVVSSILVLIALLLWKDEEGPNRYGPNPRYDAPAGPVSPSEGDIETGRARDEPGS